MKFLKKLAWWAGRKRVFLDYASITPVDKRVVREMQKYSHSANPSALYSEALLAKEKVLESREKIAHILNCQKSDIIFTSGGTEGNNLAILGIFEKFSRSDLGRSSSKGLTFGYKPHFITTTIEHPSVLEVFKEVENRGGEVTYVNVSEEGIVNPKDIARALKDNTVLVSVMYANNEVGTVQPIKEIGQVIKKWRNKVSRTRLDTKLPYFHTDACQAVNYLSVDVLKLGVDMMTVDGIKMYGPRGAGFLYIKNNVKIKPILFGGGQERGIRSGTENVPAIVGLATALEIADSMKEKESARLAEICDYGIEEILKNFGRATLNGSKEFRLPNNINICFPKLDAEFAVISLDVKGISASYSSSCRTLKEDSSSYVVESLGKSDCKNSSLRFTLGRESKKSDIDALVSALKKIVLL